MKRAASIVVGVGLVAASGVFAATLSSHPATLISAQAAAPTDDHASILAATHVPHRVPVRATASRHRARKVVAVHHAVVRRTTTTTTTRRVTVSSASSAASQMASLIESARTSRGLSYLRWNNALADSSRAHSSSMARNNQIYHTSQSQLWANVDRGCSSCNDAGEVVGMGTSVRRVFDAFMASPEHRTVILDPDFRYFGVGIVYSRGAYWVTVQFAG